MSNEQREIDNLIAQLEFKGNCKVKEQLADFTVYSGQQHFSEDHYYAKKRKEKKLDQRKEHDMLERSYKTAKSREKLERRIGKAESLDGSSMGTVDIRQGIQLTSRELTSVAGRPTYTGDHEMSDATIKEQTWDLSRIVERPTLVTAFQWAADQVSILYTGNIPASVLPIKIAKIPFETFQYWRGDVTLRLQVAGSPIVQGILAMTFVPLVDRDEMTSLSWDFCSLTINPTVYLYANVNTHAELKIPYNHFQSYLRTDFPADPLTATREQSLGFVQIYVLQPLLTVGSVQAITVSLFSIFENNQFKVPRLSSVIGKAESFISSAISGILNTGANFIEPVIDQIGTMAKNKMSVMSDMSPKDLVSKVAKKALPSNFVGDSIDVVGGLLEGALGFLGLDNPTLPTEEGRCVVKSNGSMNYAIGPEYIEKMSVMPSSMSLVTPESFGTVTDEMDVNYLYRRYSYIGWFSVSRGDTTGAVVWSIPMSPFPTFVNSASGDSIIPYGTIVQKTVNVPLLSYLGLPYRYWTGGLKFKFIVSASSLHTCRLYIAFNYGVFNTPTTLLDASSQYGVALEISQGSNEFEFAIPYVALQPYLEVCRGQMTAENCMGMLNVIVMNPLVAPTTVADHISVVVFMTGSDDFSYEWLAQVNPAQPVYQVTRPAILEESLNRADLPLFQSARTSYRTYFYETDIGYAESGLMDNQSVAPTNMAETVTDIALGNDDDKDDQIAPPQVESCVDDHFGITSISLRNLLKKYQLVKSYQLEKVSVDSTTDTRHFCRIRMSEIFKVPTLKAYGTPPVNIMATSSKGLLTWCSGMYRQFKGSLRFKIVVKMAGAANGGHYSNASVYFVPGYDLSPPDNTGYAYRADLLTMFGSTNAYLETPTSVTPINSTTRLCVLNGIVSNVLEFEIPYSSKYLSTLTYIGNTDDDRYYGLGTLYLTVDNIDNSMILADVYTGLGDESRFGTLYRVPLIFAPAVYSSDTTHIVPVSNVGSGTYGKNAGVLGKAESGDVTDVIKPSSEDVSNSAIPTNPQSGTGRLHAKPSLIPYVISRVRRYIGRSTGVTYNGVTGFIDNISNGVIRPQQYGGIIYKAGGVAGKDGMIHLRMQSRYRRRNRRRVNMAQGLLSNKSSNNNVNLTERMSGINISTV